MILLDIEGHNSRKKLCESVCRWFDKNYLLHYVVELQVINRGLRREGVWGWCVNIDEDEQNPRDFIIEIHNKMDVDTYLKILFHELFHVYQHVRGDLRDVGVKRFWKGIDYTGSDYADQPWEREAIAMEDVLYEEYLNIDL